MVTLEKWDEVVVSWNIRTKVEAGRQGGEANGVVAAVLARTAFVQWIIWPASIASSLAWASDVDDRTWATQLCIGLSVSELNPIGMTVEVLHHVSADATLFSL